MYCCEHETWNVEFENNDVTLQPDYKWIKYASK